MLKPSIQRTLFGIAVLLLIVHAGLFTGFTIDDAYITFTYTKNLVQGNGPVFFPGSHVEATSSMLWAVLLIPFEAFVDNGAVVGSKILGIFSLLGTELFGVLLVRELIRSNPYGSYAMLVFGFLLAGASPFVVWGTYGMENGMVALLLTASMWLFLKEQRTGQGFTSAFVIFLLETARPEGFIYVSLFAGYRLLSSIRPEGKTHFKRDLIWIGLLGGCLFMYEAFGFAYYGHLLPNTVRAKVDSMTFERLASGMNYLTSSYQLPFSVLLALSSGLLLFHLITILKKHRTSFFSSFENDLMPLVFLFGVLVVHWIFVLCVGGDWMPNARFLSSVIPLLLVFLVVLLWLVFQPLYSSRSLALKVTMCTLGVFVFASYCSINVLLSLGSYEDQKDLQLAENRALYGMVQVLNSLAKGKESVVAGSDIGRLGYYFKGKVLDWWGLADEEIAQLGPARRRLAASVVLRRKPDFVILYSNRPTLSSDSMDEDMAVYSPPFFYNPDFQMNYQQVDSLYFWDKRWHVLFQRRSDRALKPTYKIGG